MRKTNDHNVENEMAYHYQCANCYCTLSMDPCREGQGYYSVVNGELCSSCQTEKEVEEDED